MDERLYDQAHDASLMYAAATGVLQAVAGVMLGRLERCDRHDALLNDQDRESLALIARVLEDPERSHAMLTRELEAHHARRRAVSL